MVAELWPVGRVDLEGLGLGPPVLGSFALTCASTQIPRRPSMTNTPSGGPPGFIGVASLGVGSVAGTLDFCGTVDAIGGDVRTGEEVGARARAIASWVRASRMPVSGRPRDRWKLCSADRVRGPALPSGGPGSKPSSMSKRCASCTETSDAAGAPGPNSIRTANTTSRRRTDPPTLRFQPETLVLGQISRQIQTARSPLSFQRATGRDWQDRVLQGTLRAGQLRTGTLAPGMTFSPSWCFAAARFGAYSMFSAVNSASKSGLRLLPFVAA